MAIVMAMFALAIAGATFIENDFGSASAKALVYQSRWFEGLLFLGMVNLTGNIFLKKLYLTGRRTIFLFHLAFLVILTGAAVTRYTGFEGTLSIREGQESNLILLDRTHITVNAGTEDSVVGDYPVFFSALGRNAFREVIHRNGRKYTLEVKAYVPNAVPDVDPDDQGKPTAEIVYTDQEGRKSLIISAGEIRSIGNLSIAMDVPAPDTMAVQLFAKGDSLFFIAPFAVAQSGMAEQSVTLLARNTPHHMLQLRRYSFNGQMLVLNAYHQRGRVVARPVPVQEMQTQDALVMALSSERSVQEFILWGSAGQKGKPEPIEIGGEVFILRYGSGYREIPFSLKLQDFIVERYPGSQSPSWYESVVTLSDPERNILENRRIYMNNILKHRGYRFYQSSYDADEKGTLLSVNHDWAGTWVTYAGYLLMTVGMALSLFNRNSHFKSLAASLSSLKDQKKGLLAGLMLFTLTAFAAAQQTGTTPAATPVNPAHAARFGKLLVQDNGGRIEPLNTLSSEILRKLSRRNVYRGMNNDQVLLGMLADPGTWQFEPIIRASHPQILEIMGTTNRYFAFASFFRDNHYILQDYVEEAFRKKPAFRSKFDNEIIRLDERLNIAYLVFTGDLLRILPVPGDSSFTWYNQQGIRGKVRSADSVFTHHIVSYYLQDVQQSMKTGNWQGPDDILQAISNYQAKYTGDIMPSALKVKLEILLNKWDIFSRISKYYGAIGFVLLLLQFAGLFWTRLKLKVPVVISMVLIIIIFSIHTLGLGMRWYVSGHAPWSNGYEAMIYIGWATVLAGLLFAARSSITLSVTAILTFFILHTAHYSWMDPQITNLVPVLKSYWLVIHVATITASYGFLALGALLAFLNLLLMNLQTRKNKVYLDFTLQELTHIIEMALIAGLYLLTIGTFLGGIWANESWGRYWGWDPKETWALVTILVYAFITHMRMVPGLRGIFPLNLASVLGISTVLMTYFGVNYYLSGLHSYAKGDPIPVPSAVYYALAVIFVVAMLAYANHRRLARPTS